MAGKPRRPGELPNFDDPEATSITHFADIERKLGRNTRSAYLIVLQGVDVGEMFKLEDDGEVIIGRGSAATMRLNDDGVSRRHARIRRVGALWELEDLASANGTMVNGERVSTHTLSDGDKIRFGGTTILKFTHQDDIDQDFQQRMHDAAIRDGLTRAYNKASFLDRLEKEFAAAQRSAGPLSLVMYDLDHFKRINDTFGHLAGDHALVEVTAIVSRLIRTEDVLARYGGEEFAIICRGANAAAGGVMCERICATVAQSYIAWNSKRMPITVSMGVAGLHESHAQNAIELIACADRALDQAKKLGRNRVQIAVPDAPTRLL